MYKDELKEAIRRTRKFGLDVPEGYIFQDELLVMEKVGSKFLDRVISQLGINDLEDLAARCFSVHKDAIAIAENIFNTKALYTIGNVNLGEDIIYKKTEAELRNMLEAGVAGFERNIHTWITLPSMEIIDLTLSATKMKADKMSSQKVGFVMGYADEFKDNMKYHPMLVGQDFFRKIGVLEYM